MRFDLDRERRRGQSLLDERQAFTLCGHLGVRTPRRAYVKQPTEVVGLDSAAFSGDRSFAEAVNALLDDDQVDVGVVGCVPMTPALQTLKREECSEDDLTDDRSVAGRLLRLWEETKKRWVVAVDGGPLYDDLSWRLASGGIPTFRSIDRALTVLDKRCAWKLGHPSP